MVVEFSSGIITLEEECTKCKFVSHNMITERSTTLIQSQVILKISTSHCGLLVFKEATTTEVPSLFLLELNKTLAKSGNILLAIITTGLHSLTTVFAWMFTMEETKKIKKLLFGAVTTA